MKYNYVFLLGRPGCGKSAIYRHLEQRILDSNQATTLERVDDFPKVWATLQRNDALENEGRQRLYSERTAEGGYILTNHEVLNDILGEVSADLLTIDKPDHLIVLEFARANYVRAMENFDGRILARSLVVYMEVSFETCWARNVARHEATTLAEGGDDHLVSREQMEELYLHDDQHALVRYIQEQNIPVLVINNEAEGEEHLTRQVEELFAILF
jgi:adenylate kinase family enzyme